MDVWIEGEVQGWLLCFWENNNGVYWDSTHVDEGQIWGENDIELNSPILSLKS